MWRAQSTRFPDIIAASRPDIRRRLPSQRDGEGGVPIQSPLSSSPALRQLPGIRRSMLVLHADVCSRMRRNIRYLCWNVSTGLEVRSGATAPVCVITIRLGWFRAESGIGAREFQVFRICLGFCSKPPFLRINHQKQRNAAIERRAAIASGAFPTGT